MSETTDRKARGERMVAEVMNTKPFSAQDAYQQITTEALFGDIWSRPGLSRKERRWITLSIAGMTGAQGAIDGHVQAALSSGDITREEMMEFVIHFAHYGGWPLSTNLYGALLRATAPAPPAEKKG